VRTWSVLLAFLGVVEIYRDIGEDGSPKGSGRGGIKWEPLSRAPPDFTF
jgi:hypothetical protein